MNAVAAPQNFVPGPALDYSFMELEVLVPGQYSPMFTTAAAHLRTADLLDEEPRTGVLSSKSRLRQVEEKEVVQVAGSKKVHNTSHHSD